LITQLKKIKYPNVLGKDCCNQDEANDHWRARLKEVEVGRYLTEETAVKHSEIKHLFKTYFPWGKNLKFERRKFGYGVEGYEFQYNDSGQRHLILLLQSTDHTTESCEKFKRGEFCWCAAAAGDEEPISKDVFTCFGPGVSAELNIKIIINSAFRRAVDPQIKKFRQRVEYRCVVCKEEVSPLKSDVHHKALSFDTLVKSFKKIYNYTDEELHSQSHKRWDKWYFNDTSSVVNRWFKYHEENATLELLCKPCHYKEKAA
jgi:hypothetical protein